MQTRTISIDPRKLKLLEVNAHYMRHETFKRLVDNVKADNALTSTPFCAIWKYYNPGDEITRDENGNPVYEVLSGNHRVKAAIEARLPEIEVMVTDDPLPPDKRKAIQLSHNAIFGEDDPATLKLVYQSIEDMGMRLYSGLDDKRLELLEDVKPGSLSEANLEFQTLSMVFLPDELERVSEVWDLARALVHGTKNVWLASMESYDKMMDSLDATSQSYKVKNVATTLMLILEIFTRHVTDLSEGYLDDAGEVVPGSSPRVPITTIMGTDSPPPAVASLLKRVLDLQARKNQDAGKKKNTNGRWDELVPILQKTLNDLNTNELNAGEK